MNPSIQGLLATVDQTCMIAKNRISSFKISPEQAKEVIAGFTAAKTSRDVLAGPAFSLSKMILGDHKKLLQRNTYDALDTLSSLTFEEYVEFAELSDEKSIAFYADVQPLIAKLYQEQILPLMIKNTFGGFFKDLFGEDNPNPFGDMFGGDNPFEDQKDPDERL